MLSSYTYAEQIRRNACREPLFLLQHRVRRRSGVYNKRVHAANVGKGGMELELVNDDISTATLDTKGQHTAKSAQQTLRSLVIFM